MDALAVLVFLATDLAIHGHEVYFQAPHLLSTAEGTIVAAAHAEKNRVRLIGVGGIQGDAYVNVMSSRQATLTGRTEQVRSLAVDLRARMAERARFDATHEESRKNVLTT